MTQDLQCPLCTLCTSLCSVTLLFTFSLATSFSLTPPFVSTKHTAGKSRQDISYCGMWGAAISRCALESYVLSLDIGYIQRRGHNFEGRRLIYVERDSPISLGSMLPPVGSKNSAGLRLPHDAETRF